MSIRSEALRRGLAKCADLTEKMNLPEAVAPDAALAAPLSNDPLVALDQARRRGLHPQIAEVLWKWLEPRPLELGLFSWDVLCGSLLDPDKDQELLARLRKAACVVSDVLPEPGRAFVQTTQRSAADLVDRVAIPAFQDLGDMEQFEIARGNGLAAIEVNLVVSEPGDPDLALALVSARQFAQALHRAHMPTLATFYFNYLWKRAGKREVAADYVEVMLDAHAHGYYPKRDEILVDKTVEEAELLGYLVARNAVQFGQQAVMARDFRKAPNPVDYKKGAPAELAKTFGRSHLVHAELFLEEDELPVPFDVVQEVVKQNPSWRYAGRVRLALLARLAHKESQEPLKVLDNFLAVFGNERWAWDEMNEYAPVDAKWLYGMTQRMVREVGLSPYNRTVWEALGLIELLSDDKVIWLGDIASRAVQQCQL